MATTPFALCRHNNIFACLSCWNDSKYISLTQRHSPPSLSLTRTLPLRFHSTTHADFFRRSELQAGGAVETRNAASSFTACTFENNEAVRLYLTNRRLLRRTHTSMLFFSLRLLLLVLLLSYSVVRAMMLDRLTSRTVTAVSASGARRNHHSYGKRSNIRLVMISSLGLRYLVSSEKACRL